MSLIKRLLENVGTSRVVPCCVSNSLALRCLAMFEGLHATLEKPRNCTVRAYTFDYIVLYVIIIICLRATLCCAVCAHTVYHIFPLGQGI